MTLVVGAGMGLAMGPLTVILVRALPPSKQGVASAMTSTARELGGALGVAILESLAAPVYAAGVHPVTRLLPPGVATAVTDSLAAAASVAGALPGAQGAALLALARSAFVDGVGVAVLAGAAAAIVGAAVGLACLPGRDAARAVPADRSTTLDRAGGSDAGRHLEAIRSGRWSASTRA